jgi:hypothetical protein
VAEQYKHGALDMITMVQKLVAELGAKEEGGNATIRMFADDMKCASVKVAISLCTAGSALMAA